LEHEAHGSSDGRAQLSADPEDIQGWWFVVPLIAGAYVLLRPNVANAPAPGGKTQRSVSELQVAGEALALFGVPGGVTQGLARAGYGVIAAYGIGGAASAVSFRGVQDIGAGEFSGVEAYVIDGVTGGVIGVVIGGVFRPYGNLRGPRPASEPLVHLTNARGATGIQGSGVLRGSGGIYALPAGAANQSAAMRVLRTLLRPSQTARSVAVPTNASGIFTRPTPIGPLSAYQRLMGVYRAPAGQINLLTGQFTASGSRLANLTGQFFPYAVDGMIWVTAAHVGSTLSPTTPGGRERGFTPALRSLLAGRAPLPETERSDGPFIFVDPGAGMEGATEPDALSTEEENYGLGPGPWSPEAIEEARQRQAAQPMPGVIFVQPQVDADPFGASTP
jgi:hypothetical protein